MTILHHHGMQIYYLSAQKELTTNFQHQNADETFCSKMNMSIFG